jgi:hypothetical protein
VTRLASNQPQTLHADTIGMAWLAIARRILAHGVKSRYDDRPVREISLVTLNVAQPGPHDEIIARHADPERLDWMRANFTGHGIARFVWSSRAIEPFLGQSVGLGAFLLFGGLLATSAALPWRWHQPSSSPAPRAGDDAPVSEPV